MELTKWADAIPAEARSWLLSFTVSEDTPEAWEQATAEWAAPLPGYVQRDAISLWVDGKAVSIGWPAFIAWMRSRQ